MWRPLTSFGGDCETGIMAAEAFPEIVSAGREDFNQISSNIMFELRIKRF